MTDLAVSKIKLPETDNPGDDDDFGKDMLLEKAALLVPGYGAFRRQLVPLLRFHGCFYGRISSNWRQSGEWSGYTELAI